MSRPRGPGRVTERTDPPEEPEFPSFRRRKPVVYWLVILGVLALLLSTFASLFTAFG